MHDLHCASCGSQNIRLVTETYRWDGTEWVKETWGGWSECHDCKCVGTYMYTKEYNRACEELKTRSLETA